MCFAYLEGPELCLEACGGDMQRLGWSKETLNIGNACKRALAMLQYGLHLGRCAQQASIRTLKP